MARNDTEWRADLIYGAIVVLCGMAAGMLWAAIAVALGA